MKKAMLNLGTSARMAALAGCGNVKSAQETSAFYQYHSGCDFYYRRIAGKQKQAGVVSCVA